MPDQASPTTPDATYPADLYVAVHRGTEGDIDFYRRVCTSARSVLELGVGGGRIARALLSDGCEVTGVERDPELLEIAGRVAPSARLVRADMRELDLGARFDRVLLPYNGIYCLLDEADRLACLTSVRDHLAPEGLFVFDAWAADPFHADGAEAVEDAGGTDEDEPELVADASARDTTYQVFEWSRWVPSRQRIDAFYRHEPADGGASIDATIPQRYLLGDEVAPLLERAGLELVALLGGFDQHAYDPDDSERLIGVARRASHRSAPGSQSAPGS
jgi:SAM-dependent methyltransferase